MFKGEMKVQFISKLRPTVGMNQFPLSDESLRAKGAISLTFHSPRPQH